MVATTQKYELLEKLGQGAYASVFKGKITESGSVVAIKIVSLEKDGGLSATAVREIALNNELKGHPNVVNMIDVVRKEETLLLVFECMEMDLTKYIEGLQGKPSPPEILKGFMKDLFTGLDFCHSKKILHRDIKPQNLLVSPDFQLKLADFGLAIKGDWNPKLHSQVVTQWYRAPELLLGVQSYKGKIDTWAAGCVMGELALTRPLFYTQGSQEVDQLRAIFRFMGTPHTRNSLTKLPRYDPSLYDYFTPTPLQVLIPSLDGKACDLLKSLLEYNPRYRFSPSMALAHAYFN